MHLERYFRAWLAGVPAADELVGALSLEALIRLERSGDGRGAATDAELAMCCAAAAHGLAREMRLTNAPHPTLPIRERGTMPEPESSEIADFPFDVGVYWHVLYYLRLSEPAHFRETGGVLGGITREQMDSFLRGDLPDHDTYRTLLAWYQDPQHPATMDPFLGVVRSILFRDLPARALRQAEDMLVHALQAAHRDAGVPVPWWLPESADAG